MPTQRGSTTQDIRDMLYVRSILPEHYDVMPSKTKGSIHCKSPIGMRKPPYTTDPSFDYPSGIKATDAEDINAWDFFFWQIKKHFGERFSEVFHNTCFCHVDFTIYLKN